MIFRPMLRGILTPIMREQGQPTVFRSSDGVLIKTSDNKILAVK